MESKLSGEMEFVCSGGCVSAPVLFLDSNPDLIFGQGLWRKEVGTRQVLIG